MKLDKIKFARLVAHCISNGMSAGEYEIDRLDELTELNIPEPKSGMANAEDIDRLLSLMSQGTQKIEAIKLHRAITGMGLKESKDAIERYWLEPNNMLDAKTLKKHMHDSLDRPECIIDGDAKRSLVKDFINSFSEYK